MKRSYFYMWARRREDIISQHKFYVDEGRARLTNQFSDRTKLEKEADEHAENWLAKMSKHFDPERHDEGDFYEQAHDENLQVFFALNDLGNSARLAVISGMYHTWERSLKKWLTSRDCIGHWHRGEALPKAIWRAKFDQLFELFECAGLFNKNDPTRVTLDICRLVVNTYKHGSGDSEANLKIARPELFNRYGWRSDNKPKNYFEYVDYEDLYVQQEHLDEFSSAIVAFWESVPDHITDKALARIPKWFEKAIEKDNKTNAGGIS